MLVLLVSGARPGVAGAQSPARPVALPVPTWEELRLASGVDTAEVDWIRAALSTAEAAELLELVGALSRPDAAQLLVSWFEADPSYAYLRAWPEVRARVDESLARLRERPPADAAGVVRVAHLLARIRVAVLERYRELPYYRFAFAGEPLRVPAAAPAPARFELLLDFGPAAALLDLVATPGLDEEAVAARLQPHERVFEALVRHRSQSFYPVVVTREALRLSVQRAASSAPLARLYRFAFPLGLFHLTEVREHLPAYRALVGELESSRAALSAHVAGQILPYVPAGLRFSRTVHFLFGDGADGWVSDGVAAVDLEFLKDDHAQLLATLTHETFHAVQSAARPGPWPERADRREALLAGVLESIYQEGSANFVAPAQDKGEAERAALVARGAELLEELHRAIRAEPLDEARVQELRDQGIRGAGPFYWLGASMTGTLVQAMGPGALAEALERGGVRFFELYLEVAGRGAGEPAFSDGLRRSVAALAGG